MVWDTNMAAVSLFWDTNMAAVTSCENTLYHPTVVILLKKITCEVVIYENLHSLEKCLNLEEVRSLLSLKIP